MKNLDFLTTAVSELAQGKHKSKIPKFLDRNSVSLPEIKAHLNSRQYFHNIAHRKGLLGPGVGEKIAKKIIQDQKKWIETI